MSTETPTGEGENSAIGVEDWKKLTVFPAEPKPDEETWKEIIEVSAETITKELLKSWELEIKGPGWIRETIEPADLIKVLMYRPETKPYLSPKPEILVQYYESELDRVMELWYVIPDMSIKLWHKVSHDGARARTIYWENIDWNAFRITER